MDHPRPVLLVSLATLFALGCGPGNATPSPNDPGAASGSSESATDDTAQETNEETTAVPDTSASPSDSVDPPAATQLPAALHVVVFFDTAHGHEHLDVQVLTDDTGTQIAGVRADESRAHPVRRRIALNAEQQAEFGRRIAAIAAMPRCEPLARAPDEPLWRVESDDYNDSGPSLWLRENGDAMMRSSDPCLGYVRLAHFVYATWMQEFGLDR
jgi:hypothetical protein